MASYIIRKIDDTLWQDMKAKAATEERGLRAVVLRLFKAYTYGTPVDAVDPVVANSVDLTTRVNSEALRASK